MKFLEGDRSVKIDFKKIKSDFYQTNTNHA